MSAPRHDSSLSFVSLEPYPYSHYDNVCDAVTKGPVQEMTAVASLHTSDLNDEHNQLLQNLTRVAQPAVRCRLMTSNGDWLPATVEEDTHGCQLYLTYNHLMFSPQVRLECRFYDPHGRDAAPYHTVVLEFPFASGNGKEIEGYSKTSDTPQRISFTAHGATSSGFTLLRQHMRRFRSQERRMMHWLRVLKSAPSMQVVFELDLNDVSKNAQLQLAEIDKHLPGGCGSLLPSFTHNEYFALCDKATFSMSEEFLKSPFQLMQCEVPLPMALLAPLETFASSRQAAIHLGYAAYHAELEATTGVQAWAASTHTAAIFNLDQYDVPILAVRFAKDFTKLGNKCEDIKFKLPHELKVTATFRNQDEAKGTIKLNLVLDEISGLTTKHDAAFIILNRGGFSRLSDMDMHVYKVGDPFPAFLDIDFKVNTNSPTLRSLLQTSNKLHESTHAWTEHLLNQDTSAIHNADLTHGLEAAEVQEADEEMLSCRDWNDDQKELLESVHRTRGGMVITQGVAGTGKSTLQSSIALYFAKLGFKVLVAPPANSNASQAAVDINRELESRVKKSKATSTIDVSSSCSVADDDDCSTTSSDDKLSRLPRCDAEEQGADRLNRPHITTPQNDEPTIRRLFASSLSQNLQQLSEQYTHNRGGADSRTSNEPLTFMLQRLKDRKAGSRDFAVEQAVIDEAERGRFKMFGKNEFGNIKPEADVWDLFRKHFHAVRDGTFSWIDENATAEFAKCFELCKRHIVAATDVLVTTTGNARHSEVVYDWARCEEYYGIPCRGVIVMCDEAFKDTELGTWNAIMAAGDKTKGCFLFGDDHQLAPTNTSSKGKIVFGQFTEQLDISLPSRLVKHGFPFVYLKKQQRMHPCLSKFPNEEFYNGELRDSMRVNVRLETVMPGLADVLHGIVRDSYNTHISGLSPEHYWKTRTDEQARHHYIEVEGTRQSGEDGTSKYVQEHIDVFFKYIFPRLQDYWRDGTSMNLMIVCSYTAAKVRYRSELERLQFEQKLPDSWYPNIEEVASDSESTSTSSSNSRGPSPVRSSSKKLNPETAYSRYLTIDAAQGQESFMVWMDASAQHRDDIGFMIDRGRCNVAMTRAKGVFWIVGGALDVKRPRNKYRALSPFPKLKQQMARVGRVHRMKL